MREGRDGCYPVGKNRIRHPELDSGSINVNNRLRNKCAMTGIAKKVLSLGGESKRSSVTSYACERG